MLCMYFAAVPVLLQGCPSPCNNSNIRLCRASRDTSWQEVLAVLPRMLLSYAVQVG